VVKGKCLRGAKPLFLIYLPLMIGIHIHIMERGSFLRGGEVDK